MICVSSPLRYDFDARTIRSTKPASTTSHITQSMWVSSQASERSNQSFTAAAGAGFDPEPASSSSGSSEVLSRSSYCGQPWIRRKICGRLQAFSIQPIQSSRRSSYAVITAVS